MQCVRGGNCRLTRLSESEYHNRRRRRHRNYLTIGPLYIYAAAYKIRQRRRNKGHGVRPRSFQGFRGSWKTFKLQLFRRQTDSRVMSKSCFSGVKKRVSNCVFIRHFHYNWPIMIIIIMHT